MPSAASKASYYKEKLEEVQALRKELFLKGHFDHAWLNVDADNTHHNAEWFARRALRRVQKAVSILDGALKLYEVILAGLAHLYEEKVKHGEA